MATLREAWDDEADDWIRWARSEELDHAFWRMNLPTMLGLLPEPGICTVDVCCGEGRLSRELKARGHRVMGVEGSPALATAALAAEPGFAVQVGDAAALPLTDGCADLVVASLCLMNVDDLQGVVNEVRRILTPGGVFVFSILHPMNSWGDAGDVSYFQETRYAETLTGDDGSTLVVHDTHRPLNVYTKSLHAAAFTIDALVEPVPDAGYVKDHPHAARWLHKPGFLHVRARLDAT